MIDFFHAICITIPYTFMADLTHGFLLSLTDTLL